MNGVKLVFLSFLKSHWDSPSNILVYVLGIGFGVSLFLCSLILGKAAKVTFDEANYYQNLSSIARVVPLEGDKFLPNELYKKARMIGVTNIYPLLSFHLKTIEGEEVLLEGIDPVVFLNSEFKKYRQYFLLNKDSKATKKSLLTEDDKHIYNYIFDPVWGVSHSSYLDRYGIESDQPILLEGSIGSLSLSVRENDLYMRDSILVDITYLQQLISQPGAMSSIEIIDFSVEELNALNELIQGQATLDILGDYDSEWFMKAFSLNIEIIGFLALAIGSFIAYSTASISLINREKLISSLRLVGVSRKEVFFAQVGELLLVSLIASVIGVLLAHNLAGALLPALGLTISQLTLEEYRPILGGIIEHWIVALLIAVPSTLLSALITYVVSGREREGAISRGIDNKSLLNTWLAIALLLVALILYSLGTLFLKNQYVSLLIVCLTLLGLSMVAPAIMSVTLNKIRKYKFISQRPLAYWTVSEALLDQKKMNPSFIVFVMAVSINVSMIIMITSFNTIFSGFLASALPEDIYIDVDNNTVIKVEQFLSASDNVDSYYRYFSLPVKASFGYTNLISMTNDKNRHGSYVMLESEADVWNLIHSGDFVIVNQTASHRYGLTVGDIVEFYFGGNIYLYTVAGVYQSYGSFYPALLIDEQSIKSMFPSISSGKVGVFLDENVDTKEAHDSLITDLKLSNNEIFKKEDFEKYSLEIFKRVFLSTDILSLCIYFVSAFGIFCGFFMTYLEKFRAYLLVNVIGVSKVSILKCESIKILIYSFLLTGISVVFGCIIGWLNINVVLYFTFGWKFSLVFDLNTIFFMALIAMILMFLGAISPLLIRYRRWDIQALNA